MTATRHLSTSTTPRFRRRHLGALAAVGAVGLLLAACGGSSNAFSSSSSTSSSAAAGASGGGDKNITVGGANFTEMLIMQQLYGQLLSKAGYNVQYKAVTAREVYEPALEKGDIDVVPEYLATMADFMNGKANGKSAPSISSSDAAGDARQAQAVAGQGRAHRVRRVARRGQQRVRGLEEVRRRQPPHDTVGPRQAQQADPARGDDGVPDPAVLPAGPGEDLRPEDLRPAPARLRNPAGEAGRRQRQGGHGAHRHHRRHAGRRSGWSC